MGPIATPNPAIGAVPRRTTVVLRRVTAAPRRSGRYPRCIGKTSTSQPWNEVTLFRTRKPTTAARPSTAATLRGMSRGPEAQSSQARSAWAQPRRGVADTRRRLVSRSMREVAGPRPETGAALRKVGPPIRPDDQTSRETWWRGRFPGPSARRRRGSRESRHSSRFSRFRSTVQQGPVQRQKTQIVQSCMILDDFLP